MLTTQLGKLPVQVGFLLGELPRNGDIDAYAQITATPATQMLDAAVAEHRLLAGLGPGGHVDVDLTVEGLQAHHGAQRRLGRRDREHGDEVVTVALELPVVEHPDMDVQIAEGTSVLAADDGSAASAAGDRAYYRFPNRHFYEPEAILRIDGPANLNALLAQEPAGFSATDPVGSLYRSTPLGDLYDRRVEDLDVGAPVDAVAEVEDLDDILHGGLSVLAAYVGGGLADPSVGDDAWVVATVDGVVSGVSPLFAEERHPRGFHLLLDADRVGPDGTDLELYVVEEPGGPLRPLAARTE